VKEKENDEQRGNGDIQNSDYNELGGR